MLGPAGYHEAYAVVDEGIVRCDLTLVGGTCPTITVSSGGSPPGGVTRTGFGEGASYGRAQAEAFVAAAHQFGVGEQAASVNPFHVRLEVRMVPDKVTAEALSAPGRFEPASDESIGEGDA